jgi:membrane-bound metal-dependent hydrolase YbcI (DUF457 family)
LKFTTHVISTLAVATALVATGTLPAPKFIGNDLANVANLLAFFLVVGFGSLLPDIDHGNSFISNKFGFSLPFKHRGFTHTIYPWAFMIAYSTQVSGVYSDILLWVAIGSLGHIFGDMHTVGGVKFFGFGKSLTLFGPFVFKTGSVIEYVWLFGYGALLISSLTKVML